MNKPDLQTLEALSKAGVNMVVEYGGGFTSVKHFTLTPAEAVGFILDGFPNLLQSRGITPEMYELWRNTDGLALCKHTLKNGRLCGNHVSYYCSLDDWLKLHRNEYCYLHGGKRGQSKKWLQKGE